VGFTVSAVGLKAELALGFGLVIGMFPAMRHETMVRHIPVKLFGFIPTRPVLIIQDNMILWNHLC
jgi:hypothetical protein